MIGRVNLVQGHVKTQLIAHDKEVYDIAFSKLEVAEIYSLVSVS